MMLAFAAASVNLYAVTQDPPAPLPQFMDKEQLAQWSASQAAAAKVASSSQDTSTQFYTGKPYIADAGGYVFKYRTYNPEMSRWTSADPSGFPDGVNNYQAASNPITYFDTNGLEVDQAYSGNVDIHPSQFDASSAALNLLTGNYPAIVEDAIKQAIQIAWQVTAKGVATFDTTSGAWSNIQPFTIEGGDSSRHATAGVQGKVAGVGFAGTYSLVVTLSYNGSPSIVSQTSYSPGNPASITLTDNLIATVTETITGNLNPGTTNEYSHTYTVDVPDPTLTIYE
jgi:RHS repeat-associated protein